MDHSQSKAQEDGHTSSSDAMEVPPPSSVPVPQQQDVGPAIQRPSGTPVTVGHIVHLQVLPGTLTGNIVQMAMCADTWSCGTPVHCRPPRPRSWRIIFRPRLRAPPLGGQYWRGWRRLRRRLRAAARRASIPTTPPILHSEVYALADLLSAEDLRSAAAPLSPPPALLVSPVCCMCGGIPSPTSAGCIPVCHNCFVARAPLAPVVDASRAAWRLSL